MKWLVVFFFTNNHWIIGDNFDGWKAIQYPTMKRCEMAKSNVITNWVMIPGTKPQIHIKCLSIQEYDSVRASQK